MQRLHGIEFESQVPVLGQCDMPWWNRFAMSVVRVHRFNVRELRLIFLAVRHVLGLSVTVARARPSDVTIHQVFDPPVDGSRKQLPVLLQMCDSRGWSAIVHPLWCPASV